MRIFIRRHTAAAAKSKRVWTWTNRIAIEEQKKRAHSHSLSLSLTHVRGYSYGLAWKTGFFRIWSVSSVVCAFVLR